MDYKNVAILAAVPVGVFLIMFLMWNQFYGDQQAPNTEALAEIDSCCSAYTTAGCPARFACPGGNETIQEKAETAGIYNSDVDSRCGCL